MEYEGVRKMVHDLKIVQPWFDYVISGKKRFEIRKNDRDFKFGDILILKEYDRDIGYTGKEVGVTVEIVLYDDDTPGIQPGYCVMGITLIEG